MARSHKPSVRRHKPSTIMANFEFVFIVCGVILLFVINALLALNVIPPVIPPLLTKLAASVGGSVAIITWLLKIPGIREWLGRLIPKVNRQIVAIMFALIVTIVLLFLGVTWLFLLLSHFSLSGQDWSRWNPQGQWQFSQQSSTNVLVSDGSASCCDPSAIDIFSPDSTPLSNYAVEAKIQVLSINDSAIAGQIYFGIIVRANEDGDGNLLGIIDSSPNPQPNTFFSSIGGDQGPQYLKPYSVVDSNWHIYRVEVRGDNLKLLIDGQVMFQVTNSAYSQNTQFGLVDSGYALEVSDLSIMPLS